MGDGLAEVPVEALLAVVAVPPSSVVPAVQADATALAPRQLVELHVEAAPPGVEVAVAGCEEERVETISTCAQPQICQLLGSLCAWDWAPLRSCLGGVTGWDALVAPLAMGSQLLTHIPP